MLERSGQIEVAEPSIVGRQLRQAGGDRCTLAAVRTADEPRRRTGRTGEQLLDRSNGAVRAAVVDEHELTPDRLLRDEVEQTLAVIDEPRLLVEHRNHEAECALDHEPCTGPTNTPTV